jgi:hypothetical protein
VVEEPGDNDVPPGIPGSFEVDVLVRMARTGHEDAPLSDHLLARLARKRLVARKVSTIVARFVIKPILNATSVLTALLLRVA